jgi:hypothetical protein
MMIRFIESVRNSPGTWLFFVITSTFLTGSMVRQSSDCLKTASAKFGIVSFELAFTNENAAQIKSEWENIECGGSHSIIGLAKSNIFKDMFFLVAYSALFCVCVVLVSRKEFVYTQYLVLASMAAGALDAIENIFMLQYLGGNYVHPLLFGVPALVKFMIVSALVGYIVLALLARLYQKFNAVTKLS